MFAALESLLEVLPVSRSRIGIVLEGDVRAVGDAVEVRENLRCLAFTDKVEEPDQLRLRQTDEA